MSSYQYFVDGKQILKMVLDGVEIYTYSKPVSEVMPGVTPAMSPLHAGQSVSDVESFASMIAPGNFTSDLAGETFEVAVSYQGDAVDAETPLEEGQTAGFTVSVIGSQGTVDQFVAEPITVQYLVQVLTDEDNTVSITINDLVDPDLELTISISGLSDPAGYNGTFTQDVNGAPITVANLLSGPQCLVPPAINGDPNVGETLIIVPGLWVYHGGGEFEPAIMYTTNGANMVDETDPAAPTLLIDATDNEATITVTERATDLNGFRESTSAGVTIGESSGVATWATTGDTITAIPTGGAQWQTSGDTITAIPGV